MENAWVSPSISHSTRKFNKTHHMGRTREIGTHTFPIVWVLFFPVDSHPMVYFIICEIYGFHSMRKCSEIHRIGRAWEIGTHFFPEV